MDEGVGWEPEGGSDEPAPAFTPGIETVLQLFREMDAKLGRLQDELNRLRDEVRQAIPEKPCDKPPTGWKCSRPKGHPGPCAATRD